MNRTAQVKRYLYAALGFLCVALGFVGVFVPGMPTTVFVLSAAFLFSRSYPPFEEWLLANRWLGPSLRRFREMGGMSRSAKITALLSMWTAIAISAALLMAGSRRVAVIVVALGVLGTLCILFWVRTAPEADRPGAG
jgi:uncharacterized membrane protein YbaN (DUF454 family)